MSETRRDFKDGADWEKKYSPIKRGNGIRVRNNGTLFDKQGEDRKFVNRMEREFVWSVFDNGFFEYIQAGQHADSNVVGFLVTDNPVFFSDLTSKFAIGFQMIDWKTFEHRQDSELADEVVLDIGDVIAASVSEAPAEQTAASVEKVDTELACAKIPSAHKEDKSSTQAHRKEKNRTPNSVKRLLNTFRRRQEKTQAIPTRKAAEELRAVPLAAPEIPALAEPTSVPEASPLAPEAPPISMPTPAPVPSVLAPIHDPVVAPLPGEIPADITPISPLPSSVRPTSFSRHKPRFASPKPAAPPFSLLAPPSTPAPDPLPVPDTSAAAARAMQVRVRYLPFGIDAAKLDRQVYGPWPNATECKHCTGTGYFAGNVVGRIPCDECEGRGWNPPPDGPSEITVSVK